MTWTAEIRSEGREREDWPSGSEQHDGAMGGDGWRSLITVYGPPLNEAKAQEAKGDNGELVRVP